MRKRSICNAALFLLLMLLMTATAFAADPRASDKFQNYTASLWVESNGDFSIDFSVRAYSTMDVLGAYRITVQRYNGSNWVTESTLTPKNTPAMQTTNAIQHSASIPYEPDYPHAKYRASVTFYAKDSSGSSTAQYITD